MNIIFIAVFVSSAVILLFTAPERFLSALLDASSKSAGICVSLLATYAVWLGLMQVWEECGISRAVSRLIKPVAKKLFNTDDDKTLNAVCMNISVNMLGISGAATPYGIRAAQLLDKTNDAEYSSCMFFVLNATSIQLIPTSIIGVRVAMDSQSPYDVVLPILLTSLFSTFLALFLCHVCIRPKKAGTGMRFIQKTKGAGIE